MVCLRERLSRCDEGELKELFEFIEKEVSFSEETDSTIASTNNIGTYTENYASAPQAPVSQTSASPLQGRIFCDTAPILERYWAWRTGLGMDRKEYTSHHSSRPAPASS